MCGVSELPVLLNSLDIAEQKVTAENHTRRELFEVKSLR